LHALKVYGTIFLPQVFGSEMNFRYTPLFIGLLIGIALGLLYGWVIQPPEIEHTSPDSLQEAYRTEIILMVAEVYASEGNIQRASQRMEVFGFQPDDETVINALNFAKAHDFSIQEIDVLTTFLTDLNTPKLTQEINPP
jgi:hypothetical protein